MSEFDRRDWAVGLVLFAFSLAVSHLCCRAYFNGGETYEFCHYAEIARNLLDGRGYRTAAFWPAEAALFERSGREYLPLGFPMTRYPLFALWSALWMGIAGRTDYGMALGGMMAVALSTVSVYAAGLRLSGLKVAVAAGLLWSLSPVLQAGYGLSGYTEPLFVALMLPVFVSLALIPGDRTLQRPGAYLGIGVSAGLLHLTRSNFSFWVPLILALPAFWSFKGKWKFSLCCGAGYAALVLPATLYYRSATGTAIPPLFLWQLSERIVAQGVPYMEHRLYSFGELLSPDTVWFLWRKAAAHTARTLLQFGTLVEMPLLTILAVVEVPKLAGVWRRFVELAAVFFLWQLGIMGFLHQELLVFMGHRYYFWLAPIVVLVASNLLVRGFSQPRWRLAAGAAVALQLSFVAYQLGERAELLGLRGPGGVAQWEELQGLRRLESGAVVVTNIPTQVAWYAGSPAVHFTNRLVDLPRLTRRWPAHYLLLSRRAPGELFRYPEWAGLFGSPAGEAPAALAAQGYRLIESYPQGLLLRR